MLALVGTLSLLSGCARPVDGKPVVELSDPLAKPPPSIAAPCEKPVELPVGPMTAGAAEAAMLHNINALLACARRKAAEHGFYERRDAGLAGK